MSFSVEETQKMLDNELKPGDSFTFACSMCGGCCRKRSSPIIVSGLDVFRIAQALAVPTADVVEQKLSCHLGPNSHIPILTIRERLDGSCSLLRKGRCMVHSNKPVACALYPLGRIFDARDKQFHYVANSTCPKGTEGTEQTLGDWLEIFGITALEEESRAWQSLALGTIATAFKIRKEKITKDMLDLMRECLYLDYDTSKPYVDEVSRNKKKLIDAAPAAFKRAIKFQDFS